MADRGLSALDERFRSVLVGRVRIAGVSRIAAEIGISVDATRRAIRGEAQHPGTRALIEAWCPTVEAHHA